MALSYAIVTPARNEADNLRRLAACVVEQTVHPAAWVVVDNGSTDDSGEVVRGLASEHPWITAVAVPGEATPTRGGPVAKAFMAGVDALQEQPDVVVKLDADVSMEPDYFEQLLARFEADPELGIAGGTCYEQEDGEWRPTYVTGNRVRGASRAYRWRCYQDVLPLEDRPGWDGIDEMRAAARGWRSASLADLGFRHHRRLGRRDQHPWRQFFELGRSAHYSGYRPSYLLLRSLYRTRYQVASVALAAGYVAAALQRQPRCDDHLAREYIRRQQRLRALPTRAREALGRR